MNERVNESISQSIFNATRTGNGFNKTTRTGNGFNKIMRTGNRAVARLQNKTRQVSSAKGASR